MKRRWITKRLGELCRIEIGGTPPRGISRFWDDRKATNNVWLSIADLPKALHARISTSAEHLSNEGAKRVKVVKAGTLLVSFKLTLGRLAYADIDLRTNEAIAALQVIDDAALNNEYLYWFLMFFDWQKAAEGEDKIKGKALNKTKLATIPVLVPPLAEQQRIVAILDEAFARLAAATANAEKNLNNARELFVSHLQCTFDAEHDQVPLHTLATEITDGDHSPPPKAASGVPFITISNILKDTGEIDFSDTFFVPREYFKNLKPNKKPKVGDILYTVTGATLGIPVMVSTQREFCFQRHIGLIRPKPDVDSRWLTYALAAPYVFAQATIGSTGAAQKTVSLKVLRNLEVPKVSLPEQQMVARKLDDLADQTRRLAAIYQQKIRSLGLLREVALQKAFSGELTALPAQAIDEAAE